MRTLTIIMTIILFSANDFAIDDPKPRPDPEIKTNFSF